MTQLVLSVKDLTITYTSSAGPVPAVRGVSFDLAIGDSLGLAGESGCGKSTLANSLLRLLPEGTITSGEVTIDGKDLFALSPGGLRAVRWTTGAIVFQGALHALNPVQTAGRQVREPMHVHDTVASDDEARARSRELFERVGLPANLLEAYPHQLSGGQRQRVLIAMALACDPQLLIADEPTTALDLMVQAQVLALIGELRRESSLSLIFITHDLSVLMYVADRLAIMYAGRIVEQGPSLEVFQNATHPYTQALAAAFPTIGDPASRRAPSGLAGDPPTPGALPSGCPFHPRCPLAEDRCRTIEPDLRSSGPGQEAACVLI
jgi:peptide/nickel transport system ATP-binding protein